MVNMAKTVMIFGTFDILHSGHLSLMRQAKKLGETLIVVVARDQRVKKIKGSFPIHSEHERVDFLSEITLVDRVILGGARDVYQVIKKIKPGIIALGYDQKIFVDDLQSTLDRFSLSTKIVRLKPYKSKTRKSDIIKKHLLKTV